jgi:hypothetical protein
MITSERKLRQLAMFFRLGDQQMLGSMTIEQTLVFQASQLYLAIGVA